MKIVLTHAYFIADDEAEQNVMRPYPPLGLLYISGYLQSKNIDHEVFDGTFSTREKLISFLLDFKPDLIGIYANFLTRPIVVELLSFFKQTPSVADMKIVLGGPDVKFHQEEYLGSGAHYLVIGEGEKTFYELIEALKSGSDLMSVKGLAYKDQDNLLIRTEERNHIHNPDALPWPNREKLDLQKYLQVWKEKHGYSSLTVNTQRGCPYTCRWCSHAVFGDTYRRRSPISVVEELAYLKEKYNPDSFWFVDDVFTMSAKWIREFGDILTMRNLNISYECISRADRLNEEILTTLKNSGCRLLWIGAESGSQKIIDRMDRRVDVLKVIEMIRLAKEKGIETGTFIMLGYPGETVEDINETIQHLKDCQPDYFTVNLAYPIRGTILYTEIETSITMENGWPLPIDRDLDFKRTYNRKFYDFAIRKVYNEVYFHRNKKSGNYTGAFMNKAKAIAASVGMYFTK